MFAEVRTFNDPQQHAGSILGWQQVYDQLGRGCLSSELRQVCADRFQIFQEVLDKRVVQRGCAPKGRLCIAMSLGGAPVVQGHQVGAHSVVLLRDGEDFVLHAPEGMHFFAANVDTVRFAKLAAYELSSEQLKRLQSVSQVSVDEAVLRRVQQRIHPLFRQLLEQADAVNPASEKNPRGRAAQRLSRLVQSRFGRGAWPARQFCRQCLSGQALPGAGRHQRRGALEHPRLVRAIAGESQDPAEQFPGGHRDASGGVPAQPAAQCRAPAFDHDPCGGIERQ